MIALGAIAVALVLLALALHPQPFPPGAASYSNASVAPPVVDRPMLPGKTYALDVVTSAGRQQLVGSPDPFYVLRGRGVSVTGWVLDPRTMSPPKALKVAVDRGPFARVSVYGLDRPDVATALGIPQAENSGFRADVSLAKAPAGKHEIRFALVDQRNRTMILPSGVPVIVR